MKKFIAFLLTLTLIVTVFAACGKTDADTDKSGSGTSSVSGDSDSKGETVASETFEIQKIGNIGLDYVSLEDAGIYYENDNGLYGVMSFDGKSDTGAKYEFCDAEENYFIVATDYPEDASNISALNCCGLIDASGKEIIPQKYAYITILNERYAQAFKAEASTTNKDEAIIYFTTNRFSLGAIDGDLLYSGNWCIYDLTTGKTVDGATGTNKYKVSAYGSYLKYYTDDNTMHFVNANGNTLSDKADIFDNGEYALDGAVYDTNDNKLFSYDVNSYVPYTMTGDYYIASLYENNAHTYVLMDRSGKTVGAIFNDTPEVYGDLIESDGKLYDFNGNQITNGSYERIYYDEFLGNCWMLKNEDSYTVIEKDGTVIYQATASSDKGVHFDHSDFLIYDDSGDTTKYYCLKDKDFTIEGHGICSWIVEHDSTKTVTLTDVITGDVILEGYADYNTIEIEGVIYVYAETADGTLDIYTIK